MRVPAIDLKRARRNWRLWFHGTVSAVVIVLALLLFIYPAILICFVVTDSQLRQTGESQVTAAWFKSAAPRYLSWANMYLETNYAKSIDKENVPATEWPMFGSLFFLVTADDLYREGKIDASQGTIREAIDRAAEIVASPVTGTWVRKKWGPKYLEKEDVFYRTMMILGLTSYEKMTGNTQYHQIVSRQRATLADELMKAKYHLADDYPGECWPADMLWAVAAIQRAARLDGTNHDELAKALMATFNGPLLASEGLPAFQADSRSGRIIQTARGCGNSGILLFAAELNPTIAGQWYDAYEKNFWKDTGWIAGFTEMQRGARDKFMDVDSGLVVSEVGSVASGFGIGAARTSGRFDHAAPLTMEAIACSWPTPFGPLIPGFMSRVAAQSWSLGEVALLFSMTRPTLAERTIPFEGHVPYVVWIALAVYLFAGTFFIWYEIRCLRRQIRRHKERIAEKEIAVSCVPAPLGDACEAETSGAHW
jgi:hypothetical protein